MKLVKKNQKLHNHDSPLLIGDVGENDVVKEIVEPSYIETCKKVLTLVHNFQSASSFNFFWKTIPINLKKLSDMGVSTKVSFFSIPLGATINMDSTSIFQVCAVMFLMNTKIENDWIRVNIWELKINITITP